MNLKEIVRLLSDLSVLLRLLIRVVRMRHEQEPLHKRWAKQDVLDKLQMSESTYKRNLNSGLLKPIRLSGFDEYFEEDLLEAMEQSRLKGRI